MIPKIETPVYGIPRYSSSHLRYVRRQHLPTTRVPKYRNPSTWVLTPLSYKRPPIYLDR